MVLQRVAQALRETVEGTGVPVRLRKSDVVTRYGGEEFAVLLLDAQAPGAASVAERIRSAVAEMPIPLPDGATVRVTMSLGVASLPDSAADADRLILAADQALYRAKATGRNRVEVAEPETPRPAGP
jgi:diguanylate cyclase (GGDEF)-like protein